MLLPEEKVQLRELVAQLDSTSVWNNWTKEQLEYMERFSFESFGTLWEPFTSRRIPRNSVNKTRNLETLDCTGILSKVETLPMGTQRTHKTLYSFGFLLEANLLERSGGSLFFVVCQAFSEKGRRMNTLLGSWRSRHGKNAWKILAFAEVSLASGCLDHVWSKD